ncbi:MAG: glucosamine-6-phosphate deaminase [Chloroflexi bacterium]|nr:glucosamine-6-phosphate deaminase [Chloroflexota bacterium]
MGNAAAKAVLARLRQLLQEQKTVRMVFAAAPSQNEFLDALTAGCNIDWQRVEAFHMDEYIGLPPDAPQRFGAFLDAHIFSRLPFGRIVKIDASAPDAQAECQRYAALLAEKPLDIVCAGIGENGHMAFNDPPVADFNDPEAVKVVRMDLICRQQQVNDGAFATLGDVPEQAITLTMPTLLSARWLYCMVPGVTKTAAVAHTLHDPISTACPATALRNHPAAILYLDADSAALI